MVRTLVTLDFVYGLYICLFVCLFCFLHSPFLHSAFFVLLFFVVFFHTGFPFLCFPFFCALFFSFVMFFFFAATLTCVAVVRVIPVIPVIHLVAIVFAIVTAVVVVVAGNGNGARVVCAPWGQTYGLAWFCIWQSHIDDDNDVDYTQREGPALAPHPLSPAPHCIQIPAALPLLCRYCTAWGTFSFQKNNVRGKWEWEERQLPHSVACSFACCAAL